MLSLAIAALLGEAILRTLIKADNNYYPWTPGMQATFFPSPGIMPGIEGESHFEVNSVGIRGDEIPSICNKILAVGGSTTECLYLDQKESWPYLLQEILNKKSNQEIYWVGNVGKSGLTSQQHIIQLQYLLPQLEDTKLILVLMGINDLSFGLSFGSINDSSIDLVPSVFNVYPNYLTETSCYKKTRIWTFLKRLLTSINTEKATIQNEAGTQYKVWRDFRKNSTDILTSLPDLSVPLSEYSSNIVKMIDLAESFNMKIIFLTQPVLWADSLEEKYLKLLWMGGVGNFQLEGGKYYAVEPLANGMKMFNNTLIQTCNENKVEVIDLAGMLRNDKEIFYDDCHFNEYGSERIGRIVYSYLKPL